MQNVGIGYNAMNSIYQLGSENPKEVFAWWHHCSHSWLELPTYIRLE